MDEKTADLSVSAIATQDAIKEYTDEKGQPIIVSKSELDASSLKLVSPDRLGQIANIKEFKTKELCQNCKFWNVIDERLGVAVNGECRVHAPEVIVLPNEDRGGDYFTVFPLIGPFQWCGEYKAIDKPNTL